MPAAVTRYSIFIASPGDVQEERAAAIEVIQRWNNLNSQRSKIVLEPLLWEANAAPDFDSTPQDRINTDLLARADLLVAILWSRAGTPTRNFASGTLEEIGRFPGRKMVYFCQRPRVSRPGTDDAEQAAKVDAFRSQHDGKAFFREFVKLDDFRDLLFDNLVLWSNDLAIVRGPSELLPYDVYRGDPTLLAEWAGSERDGTVLVYNAELTSFQDFDSFQQIWGRLAQQPRIKKVILLLPRYKMLRLRNLVGAYRDRVGSLDRFHVCPLVLGGVHAGEAPSDIGFAMFVPGDDPTRGQPHGRAHVFVLAPPFSTVDPETSFATETFWDYRHALEVRELPGFTRELHRLFVNQYQADAEKPLAEHLETDGETSPTCDAIDRFEEEKQPGRPSFYQLFPKARQVRERLFDPNVPTYVLDEDFFLLDWNPTFEMIFPTERFNRGDFVRSFLICLTNFQNTLESGKVFLNDSKPLFHSEDFVYESPRYGRMSFTKVTSPVRDADRRILGWNVALNVDEVEKRTLFNEDRNACVELDALLTRYSASYDRIVSVYSEYELLAMIHAELMGNAKNVLDLGCGPGVLTQKLVKPGRIVTAIDCNDAMLDRLLTRCDEALMKGRLRVAKGNIEVLNGLQREFDGAVLLNVLYAVRDKEACLKRIHEVLIDGAPIVISGPREDADLELLFAEIARTRPVASRRLLGRGRHDDLERERLWEEDHAIFKEVNLRLQQTGILRSLPMGELIELLEKNGFEVERSKCRDRIYAGQGMLVVARRRPFPAV